MKIQEGFRATRPTSCGTAALGCECGTRDLDPDLLEHLHREAQAQQGSDQLGPPWES